MRLGVDLLALDELDDLAEREWFLRFAFAGSELEYATTLRGGRRREFLAGRFAAKEAVLKVLGLGLFDGVPPHDIALDPSAAGEPVVTLRGAAARVAQRIPITGVTVSITHKRGLVAAVAVGW